jgi:RNA polymerase sigma-70 factor (ECF subfamily)
MQHRTGLPGINETALAELYQRHIITLLSYTRRYLATREDAEDVLIEVFLAANEYSPLLAFSEDEQLAWLRRVARNKCVDLLRRQQRHPTLSLESVSATLYEPDEESPERVVLCAEEHSLLRNHLAALPAQQQTILYLKFGQRLSGVEIARQLNKSESSVSMLLSRALNRLRHRYGSKEGDHPDE